MIKRAELKNEHGWGVKIEESKEMIKVYFNSQLIDIQMKDDTWATFNYEISLFEKLGYRIISMYMNSKENEQ